MFSLIAPFFVYVIQDSWKRIFFFVNIYIHSMNRFCFVLFCLTFVIFGVCSIGFQTGRKKQEVVMLLWMVDGKCVLFFGSFSGISCNLIFSCSFSIYIGTPLHLANDYGNTSSIVNVRLMKPYLSSRRILRHGKFQNIFFYLYFPKIFLASPIDTIQMFFL